MKTKKVRINWAKMHTHNYGGCAECGGHCTDADSVTEWGKAAHALDIACQNGDTKHANYLRKKINDKKNYVEN